MLTLVGVLALHGTVSGHGPAKYTVSGMSNGHSYSVTLRRAKFERRGRHIRWAKSRHMVWFPAFRDGSGLHRFYGERDGYSNDEITKCSALSRLIDENEVVGLEVKVDGRRWHVPRRLYNDLIDPNFDEHNFSARLSRDGSILTVTLGLGDGGGGCEPRWTLRRSGNHSRLIHYPG